MSTDIALIPQTVFGAVERALQQVIQCNVQFIGFVIAFSGAPVSDFTSGVLCAANEFVPLLITEQTIERAKPDPIV